MAEYIVTRKADGVEVYRYQSDAPVEWNGMAFDTHDHTELTSDAPDAPVVDNRKFGGRRVITKLEFRSLFPVAALKAIDRFEVQFENNPALTDEQKDEIRTAFNDYNAAQDVNLDDPRWVPGLGLYVALGYMTDEEVSEVLNG